ncbi:MAG: hypothetical protein ACFFB2_03850 [Promethearchaeota archaeon]
MKFNFLLSFFHGSIIVIIGKGAFNHGWPTPPTIIIPCPNGNLLKNKSRFLVLLLVIPKKQLQKKIFRSIAGRAFYCLLNDPKYSLEFLVGQSNRRERR